MVFCTLPVASHFINNMVQELIYLIQDLRDSRHSALPVGQPGGSGVELVTHLDLYLNTGALHRSPLKNPLISVPENLGRYDSTAK